MQNKTPIVVLTGLGIVAAAAVAGLTRDRWMGETPQVVATAPAPEAPKTPDQPAVPAEQPAATAEAPQPAGQPAATAEAPQPAEQPVATAEAPQPAEQPAAAAEAPQPAEQPAATAEAPQPAEQPAATAPADTDQQTAAVQPETQPEQPAPETGAAAPLAPAFDTVRVEKTGEAVIAGTAPAGAEVVVMLDGKVIGKTTANGDGAFVLVPENPLPAGSGALTLEATAKGEAAPIPSRQSVAVIVPAADQPQEALVAVVSPDEPTKVLQKPEVKPEADVVDASATPEPAEKPAKLVSIDAVDYDTAGNIVFSGQGNEGNTARVYIDNNFIGDAQVGADGKWAFSATAQVQPGVHTLRVDGLDGEGKVLNRVEVPFVREQQDKVADATQPAQTTAPAQPETAPKSDAETTQQPAAAAPAKPKEGRVVIQPGNNLWRMSRVLYGDGSKFTLLYEANKDQIRNPDRIYPGQVFRTPDVAPASESIDPKRRDPLKPEESGTSGQ